MTFTCPHYSRLEPLLTLGRVADTVNRTWL